MFAKLLAYKEHCIEMFQTYILFKLAKYYDPVISKQDNPQAKLQREVMAKARTLYDNPTFKNLMDGIQQMVLSKKIAAVFRSKLTGNPVDLLNQDSQLLSFYMHLAIAGSIQINLDEVDKEFQRGFTEIRAMAYTIQRNVSSQGKDIDMNTLKWSNRGDEELYAHARVLITTGVEFTMLLIAYEYGIFNPYKKELVPKFSKGNPS